MVLQIQEKHIERAFLGLEAGRWSAVSGFCITVGLDDRDLKLDTLICHNIIC